MPNYLKRTPVRILLILPFIAMVSSCISSGEQRSPLVTPTTAQTAPTPSPEAALEPVLPTPTVVTAFQTVQPPTGVPTTSLTVPAAPSVVPTDLPSLGGLQPPVDSDIFPLPPAQMARYDLARRLRIDAEWIHVIEAVTRAPTQEDLSCLKGDLIGGGSWTDLEKVTSITLSYKSKIYHYVAAEGMVTACDS